MTAQPSNDLCPQPANSGFMQHLKLFAPNMLLLFMLLGAISLFHFETENRLPVLLPLIFGGYCIHEWLPFRYRLPFFLLLGFLSVYLVAGPLIAAVIIVTGLLLFGIAHLPVRQNLKIALALVAALVLALVRTGRLPFPLLNSALPFIASMFMFRFILYLYELQFEKAKVSLVHRLSYFFLLPNMCFPLFPIVDYKTFSRSYYTIEYRAQQREALLRIFRGLLHLLIYRFLYYYLVPAPADIQGPVMLLQFIVFSYLLIFRISGLYHFASGVIMLFGFNLPPVFNNYLLSTGFNDLWRRINTYWRDFMLRVFYQPVFFRVKKISGRHTVAITVLIVFVINWFFHNYQWFWIRGNFALKVNDILFWLIFGIAVMLNSVYQQNKGKTQNQEEQGFSGSVSRTLKRFGIFFFIATLWLMWGSSSMSECIYIASKARLGSVSDWLLIISVLFGAFVLATLADRLMQRPSAAQALQPLTHPPAKLVFCYAVLLFFAALLPHTKAGGGPVDFIASLQQNRLNKADEVTMERGYYQKLLSNEDNNLQPWKDRHGETKMWKRNNDATVKTGDLLEVRLEPDVRVAFKGAHMSINHFGMRDKEYTLEKPANTFRIALTGGSYEMGSGVDDGENYESLIEDMLNMDAAKAHEQRKYEILNFAVGGYHIYQNVKVASEKVPPFHPDMLIYVAHTQELARASRKLSELIVNKKDLQYDFLKQALKIAGIRPRMSQLEVEYRLRPLLPTILRWGYRMIAESCKKEHIQPVWVFLPTIDTDFDAAEYRQLSGFAAEDGFSVISLADIYKNYNLEDLKLTSWDIHPNPQGHRVIADALYMKLKPEINRYEQGH